MSAQSTVPASARPGDTEPRGVTPLEIVRVLVIVAALVTFVIWGISGFTFPWNIVAAVVTPGLVLLVWALFVSPRAVIRVHPFVRVLIELLIFASATIAWWSMGASWVGLAFGIVAVTTGVISGRRALA